MNRGPKTKPLKLKQLNGDIHKERWNTNQPKPETAIPTCPQNLDGGAKYEWRRITKELNELGIISRIDRAELAAYCSAYSRWMQAEAELKRLKKLSTKQSDVLYKTTNGNLIINPLLSVLRSERDACHRYLVEFGMTPSSRNAITGNGQDKDDEFDSFLSAGRDN
jgi:P27 family predicted phage terminase small subunit